MSLLGENVSISLSYIEDYSSRDYVVSGVQYLLTGGAGSQQPVDLFLAPYSRSAPGPLSADQLTSPLI